MSDQNNGAGAVGPNPDRVPPLPPIPPFEANKQHWQRMPDGETFRVVQYGALDMQPTVLYVGIGTIMTVVADRMKESAVSLMQGWGNRWQAYKQAADGAQVDFGHGVMKLDGRDNLNSGQRPPNDR